MIEYIGLDIHKSYCQAAIIDECGEIIGEERFETTKEEIIKFFNDHKKSNVVLESTGVWEFVYEIIQSCDCQVILSNPLKTRMIAEAQIKTDKVDARTLAQLLRTNMIPKSYVPVIEIRESRKNIRGRLILKKISTTLKNHIYAELIRRGIKYKSRALVSKIGRKRMKKELSEPRLDQAFNLLNAVEDAISEP